MSRTGSANLGQQLATYLREGVWHIWLGLDHILFLLCLLLPAARRRGQHPQEPSQRRVPLWIEVVKVVTSFTVAHSITLSLATLGILSFPARLVEFGYRRLGRVRRAQQPPPDGHPATVADRASASAWFTASVSRAFSPIWPCRGMPCCWRYWASTWGWRSANWCWSGLFFGMVWALRRLDMVWPQWATPLPACVIAIVAAIWFIERAFGVALAG